MDEETRYFRAVPERWNGHYMERRFRMILDLIEDEFRHVRRQLRKIRMKQDELAAALAQASSDVAGVSAQLSKAFDEIIAKINELLNGEVSPEVEAGLNELKAKVEEVKPVAQELDDIVPDQP